MMRRKKQQPWFIKIRGSYLPCSWQGWLSYAPYCAFLAASAAFGVQTRDSAAEIVFFIVPQWIAATLVLTWIANQKS